MDVDTIVPIMSALAAIGGLLLFFGKGIGQSVRRTWKMVRRELRRIRRTRHR